MKIRKLIILVLGILVLQGVTISQVIAEDNSPQKSTLVEVVFETTMGSFSVQLNPEKAPVTVANFLRYVDEGFYSNTVFHRVIPRFVVQAGGFEKPLKKKPTHASIINESDNGLQNIRGTISMARTNDPNSATSQFFINLTHNPNLDQQVSQPGYTVFGKIIDGMDTIDSIAKVPTTQLGFYKNIPQKEVVILSARRKLSNVTENNQSETNQDQFIAGVDYIVLDKPIATRDSSKIEVVEMFSYGCPHCYEFESLIKGWAKQQASDVDFWYFPAVWNKPMEWLARAFYVAQELNMVEKIHHPLFAEIVIKQKRLSTESDLANFFVKFGVEKQSFNQAYNSSTVINKVKQAVAQVRSYQPVGVPELVVNGKYRIDRMRAGGLVEMLAVVEFLINKERALLKKKS